MLLLLVLRWGQGSNECTLWYITGHVYFLGVHYSPPYRHRGIVGLWHCDLRPDNQTAGCHQSPAHSSGSRCLHYSSSQHVAVFVRARRSSPRHFPCRSHSACAVLNINVLCFAVGVQFTVCRQIQLCMCVCVCVYLHTCMYSNLFCSSQTQAGEHELNSVRVPLSHNDRNNFLIANWEHCGMMSRTQVRLLGLICFTQCHEVWNTSLTITIKSLRMFIGPQTYSIMMKSETAIIQQVQQF